MGSAARADLPKGRLLEDEQSAASKQAETLSRGCIEGAARTCCRSALFAATEIVMWFGMELDSCRGGKAAVRSASNVMVRRAETEDDEVAGGIEPATSAPFGSRC